MTPLLMIAMTPIPSREKNARVCVNTDDNLILVLDVGKEAAPATADDDMMTPTHSRDNTKTWMIGTDESEELTCI